MPSVKRETHQRIIQQFEADYAPAKFTIYQSERTGMRSVVVDRKGPKVQGYFTLATEIHDDSGAPHTLEHLVFMGSKTYKYKGVLDKLATRAYSNTNAWTATDHTAYTLDTAGWDGFAQILPIYLEHILLPTLTDEGCYTEVHHVDGTGRDAGVVYSEMQGVQNNQAELMELHARRIMYPEGDGFRYETGGMMEQLRVLTADRIREFHKVMYQPKNLCLILVGEINHESLLDILDTFEDGALDDLPPIEARFSRPWVDSKRTPLLSKTTVDRVEFPEADESYGEILIGFFGPDCLNATLDSATNVLLTYLAESSVSVLVNTLVEKEQLASSVYYQVEVRPNLVIWFTLSAVETPKVADVETRFFEILRDAAVKPLDMPYMRECLARFRRQIKFSAESSASVFTDPIIYDHLFSKRDGEILKRSLSSLSDLDELDSWTEIQWKSFLKQWLADADHVSILGVPSKVLSEKLKEDEKARVKAQQEKLGELGLMKLAQKLEQAKAENDKPIPSEVLEQFEIPDTESIHFFPSITARSGLAKKMGPIKNDIQEVIDRDAADLPLFVHVEHIPTNFAHVNLILSTVSVPLKLKPLLSVYLNNFFNTPINQDEKRVEFEKVVAQLEKDTVSYDIDTGSAVGNCELIRIRLIVQQDKYEVAIRWIRDMLFDSIFDIERLKTTVNKLLADVPDEKRSGNGMCYAVNSMIHYTPAASSRAQNTLVKALYLKRILKQLEREPEEIIGRMEALRRSLARFGNARAFVVANVETLPRPISSWKTLVDSFDTSEDLAPLDSRQAVLSDAGKSPGSLAYIVPMPPIDSSFLLLTGKCLDSYAHPKLPALIVALSYLDAVEGPMWVAVRGTGLAYGTSFARETATGLLAFRVYRSPDAFKAYSVAKMVIEEYISGKRPFEKHALEGAVSSIVVDFVNEEPTMSRAALSGFVNQVVRGVGKDWKEEMLKKVRAVKVEEIKEVLQGIVLPVFKPETANLVVSCATIMEEGLKKNFEEAGFKPEVQALTFFQDDYGLKLKDDDESDVEAEGDEEEYGEGEGDGDESISDEE
ncbi:metallopeptidase [Pseudovirgaria hyperparasitica]|uniref:Metallopeptidase n=1 Tax=Pseudovirgaria hyperparasitica TaxID=470096 RepID=A0A6A6W3Y0_9PEZI|nr:metallopeptidase [Pseudovirgaria hyperparasitica]KAF2757265.1 metallopeptidase [Pseudovirgaria hyperparasitica]